MSEAKFTKGPWRLGDKSHYGYFNIGSENGFVVIAEENYGAPYIDVSDEDAHLIAAAPELYEALAETERYFSDEDGLDEAEYDYRHRVRAALAKARGEL